MRYAMPGGDAREKTYYAGGGERHRVPETLSLFQRMSQM